MPRGFIVLPDGRCFSRTWGAHDLIVQAIAEACSEPQLQSWLFKQLPGPDDVQELGYGAWLRTVDEQITMRKIDTRLMTAENQRLFCEAVKLAAINSAAVEPLQSCLYDLADMVGRVEQGEPPLSKSDLRSVYEPHGDRIGPGWLNDKAKDD